MSLTLDQNYWSTRYQNGQTGWDIGYVSTPLKTYFDQLTSKDMSILIPGGGNSYEAEYLYQQGFEQVHVVDLAKQPLENLKARVPQFPEKQLIQGNFFDLDQSYDLIVEQTFFSALHPRLRPQYVAKMASLLKPAGKLVGVLFDEPLFEDHPPFGGNEALYRTLFQDTFEFKHLTPK